MWSYQYAGFIRLRHADAHQRLRFSEYLSKLGTFGEKRLVALLYRFACESAWRYERYEHKLCVLCELHTKGSGHILRFFLSPSCQFLSTLLLAFFVMATNARDIFLKSWLSAVENLVTLQ